MRSMIRCAAVLSVAVVAAAGCGSDDAEKTSNSSSDSSSKADNSSDSSSDSSKSADESKAQDAFSKLVSKQSSARYKITYEIKSGGSDTETTSVSMTMATDGKRKSLQTQGATIYEDGSNQIIVCTDTGSGTPTCVSMPNEDGSANSGVGAMAATFMAAAEAIKDSPEDVDEVGSKTIAGRETTCWKYKYNGLGTDATAETCLDNESGAPLSIGWTAERGNAAGSSSVVATEVS